MDYIEGTIKNLDDIIHKTKNFAFLTWGGSLYLIAKQLSQEGFNNGLLYLLTAGIPLLFWAMDYNWRKHLLKCGMRKRVLSAFINSPAFDKWVADRQALPESGQFPLYDPVGWNYTRKNYPNGPYAEEYLVDDRRLSWYKVAFYKDAYLFYGVMVVLSVTISVFYF